MLGEGIRLLAYTVAAGLQLFLICAFLGKRRASFADRLVVLTLAAAMLWCGSKAVGAYSVAVLDPGDSSFLWFIEGAGSWGALLAPAFLLHLALVWAGAPLWSGAPCYVAALLAWWMPESGRFQSHVVYVGGCLVGTAALSTYTSAQRAATGHRRFHAAFAICVALLVVGFTTPASALFPIALVLVPACVGYFVYRYNLFEILIGRRTIFVFTLALVSAVYLLLVSRIARFSEEWFEAFGPLVEVSLILGAAVIWLPLYGWITRFFSRRTQMYAEFCKQVIERAVRILEVGQRIQFLAEETGKLFGARRVLLHKSSAPKLDGAYNCETNPELSENIEKLIEISNRERHELIHVLRTDDPAERALLEKGGFNYAIPLWYEENLTGMLLVDTTPRYFLDENEPILLGLSRQISHSIEACRLVEEKISLEKALLRQEHLASLGQAAATIAHEVKNPLSSIKTLAQLMREDPAMAARYHRDLGYIITETDRLDNCVRQLLTFSRPAPSQSVEVPIFELLETTAETLRLESAGNQIRVEHDIEPGLRDFRADRQTLQQVVLNLVLNAIEASPAGATVRLSATVEPPGTVRIDIVDEGPGIPQEVRDKIFEPFFTSKQKGSGLGLAIARRNLRLLHGEIQVTSPVVNGRGTSFTVKFPAHREQE